MTTSNGHGLPAPGPSRLPATPPVLPADVGRPALETNVTKVRADHGGEPRSALEAAQQAPPLGSIGGLDLPPEFNTPHFLDPGFVTAIANEINAEDRPPDLASKGQESPPVVLTEWPTGSSVPVLASPTLPLSRTPPTASSVPESFSYQDPRTFLTTSPAPLPSAPPAGFEGFYFLLPQATPPLAQPSAPVTPPLPVSDMLTQPVPPGSRPPIESPGQGIEIPSQAVHGKPPPIPDSAASMANSPSVPTTPADTRTDPRAFLSHLHESVGWPPLPVSVLPAASQPIPADDVVLPPVPGANVPLIGDPLALPGVQATPPFAQPSAPSTPAGDGATSQPVSRAPVPSPKANGKPGTPLVDVPAAPAVPASDPFYFLTPSSVPVASPTLPAEPRQELASKPAPQSSRPFQIESIRQDFPILSQTVHGRPLIWLDNAATTQKPRQVIDAISQFYERDNSNIHRGAHTLAARATNLYEGAREKVRRFLGAGQSEEVIFVHGATEAINLVAQTYGRKFIGEGDEIVLTTIEHHANIVPWQHVAQEKGAVLRVVPVNDRGEIILEEYERLLSPRTKFVALTHVSNALGTIVPVRLMTELAHRYGARVLIDGAQSTPHLAVDVQQLDCDFYIFSGHKLFGPTGIGAVYGKRSILETMPPWQGGGNMIDQVTFEQTTYQQAPMKFEAGTGILAGAVGLGAAIDYLEELGLGNIARYEHELLEYATEGMKRIPGLRPIGTAAEKASLLSFVLEGFRTEDMGRYLDHEGIAVRAGHHCAQPTMRRFGVNATVRPSLAFFNTHGEIDVLLDAIRKAPRRWGQ